MSLDRRYNRLGSSPSPLPRQPSIVFQAAYLRDRRQSRHLYRSDLPPNQLQAPTIGVRDVGSGWKPIRGNFIHLEDPNSAIFPYKWITHPENRKLLLNPGHCPEDPLKGACIPKDKWWLIATRYGDLEAVKYRKLELADKEKYHRDKAYRDWRYNYIYVEGCADPISLRSKPTLHIRPATKNLFGQNIDNDKRPVVLANKSRTGYYLGDVIVAEEKHQKEQSRKRKAEVFDAEPDLTARNLTESRYGGQSLALRATVEVEEAVPTLGPLPRTIRPRTGRAAARNNIEVARSMLQALRRPTRWLSNAMKSVSGFVTHGVRAIVDLTFRHRTYNVVEQRVADQETGNVRSTRRRVLVDSEDEGATLQWVTDPDHAQLLNRRNRLVAALRHTHSCIYDALQPEHKRTIGPKISDPWRHLELSRFFHRLAQVQEVGDILEVVYATQFWNDMRAEYPAPSVRPNYFLNPDQINWVKRALQFLENYDPILWHIAEAFDVTNDELASVCADLRAILSNKPIPSMVVGSLIPNNTPWQPEPVATESAAEDASARLENPAPGLVPDVSGRSMPGTFPVESAERHVPQAGNMGKRAKRVRFAVPEVDQDKDKKPRKRKDLASTLPLWHETIPIEVIRKYLVSPELAKFYGKRGKLPKVVDYQSNLPERSPLLSKKARTSLPSPRRIRKEVFRKTMEFFPGPEKEYVPEDCYYWQYGLDGTPLKAENPSSGAIERITTAQEASDSPKIPTTVLSATDRIYPNEMSSPCPPARRTNPSVPSIVISSASSSPAMLSSPEGPHPATARILPTSMSSFPAATERNLFPQLNVSDGSRIMQLSLPSSSEVVGGQRAVQATTEAGVHDAGQGMNQDVEHGDSQVDILSDFRDHELENAGDNVEGPGQKGTRGNAPNNGSDDTQSNDDSMGSHEKRASFNVSDTAQDDKILGRSEAVPNEDSILNEEMAKHEANVLDRARSSIIEKYMPRSIRRPFQEEADDGDEDDSGLQISEEKQAEIDDLGAHLQILFDLGEHVEKKRIETKKAEEAKLKEQERLRATGGLRRPNSVLVAPISDNWVQKVKDTPRLAMASVVETKLGTGLKPSDFSRVVPETEWLNDEIVNGSLEWLDDYINAAAGITNDRSSTRKCLCLSSFLWNRIEGGHNTDRALRRFGISAPAHFLQLETVLIPICKNYHWTLIVIRPQKRTIAHMDSLNAAGSRQYLNLVLKWLGMTLKDQWNKQEWSVVNHSAPQQTNGYDCGIHAITNGMCIALGIHPIEAYQSSDMPLQRLRIAAMLLNQGFKDDFDLSGV